MRSIASSSVCRLQAKEMRMWPGAPNPEPGTTATPPSFSTSSANSPSVLQPSAVIAFETSAKA